MDATRIKKLNETWLSHMGVCVNAELPCTEEPRELASRSAEEVATRAWVM